MIASTEAADRHTAISAWSDNAMKNWHLMAVYSTIRARETEKLRENRKNVLSLAAPECRMT
jgi:hypothetical protein